VIFILEEKKPIWNSSLKFEQSILHEKYLLHLFNIFTASLCRTIPKVSIRKPNSITGKIYKTLYFATHSEAVPCFNEFHSMFYCSEKKKIIPLNIIDILTPIGLAYWAPAEGGL